MGVFNLIANGLLPRHGGTYVDLAANDAIFRSSTYFLDACLGWKGVCVEANPATITASSSGERASSCRHARAMVMARLARLDKRDPTGGSSRLERGPPRCHVAGGLLCVTP